MVFNFGIILAVPIVAESAKKYRRQSSQFESSLKFTNHFAYVSQDFESIFELEASEGYFHHQGNSAGGQNS